MCIKTHKELKNLIYKDHDMNEKNPIDIRNVKMKFYCSYFLVMLVFIE